MCEFTVTGNHRFSFWQVNESDDFAIIPSGKIKGFQGDLPIRLQVGDPRFGQIHISNKRQNWVEQTNMTIPELIYHKLGQAGTIYCAESLDKLKIHIRAQPDLLIILQHRENQKHGDFLNIVTIYTPRGYVDGDIIGRYSSEFRQQLQAPDN